MVLRNSIYLTQYTFLKGGVSIYDFLLMHPKLLGMYSTVLDFCINNNIKCVITSIWRPPDDGISKSRTHQTMRAIDISLKAIHGWNSLLIAELKGLIEREYKNIGAINASSGESRPIVIHDAGSGIHAHLQIRPNL